MLRALLHSWKANTKSIFLIFLSFFFFFFTTTPPPPPRRRHELSWFQLQGVMGTKTQAMHIAPHSSARAQGREKGTMIIGMAWYREKTATWDISTWPSGARYIIDGKNKGAAPETRCCKATPLAQTSMGSLHRGGAFGETAT